MEVEIKNIGLCAVSNTGFHRDIINKYSLLRGSGPFPALILRRLTQGITIKKDYHSNFFLYLVYKLNIVFHGLIMNMARGQVRNHGEARKGDPSGARVFYKSTEGRDIQFLLGSERECPLGMYNYTPLLSSASLGVFFRRLLVFKKIMQVPDHDTDESKPQGLEHMQGKKKKLHLVSVSGSSVLQGLGVIVKKYYLHHSINHKWFSRESGSPENQGLKYGDNNLFLQMFIPGGIEKPLNHPYQRSNRVIKEHPVLQRSCPVSVIPRNQGRKNTGRSKVCSHINKMISLNKENKIYVNATSAAGRNTSFVQPASETMPDLFFNKIQSLSEELREVRKLLVETRKDGSKGIPAEGFIKKEIERHINSRVDLNQLVNQVYYDLTRRIRLERERRGLYAG